MSVNASLLNMLYVSNLDRTPCERYRAKAYVADPTSWLDGSPRGMSRSLVKSRGHSSKVSAFVKVFILLVRKQSVRKGIRAVGVLGLESCAVSQKRDFALHESGIFVRLIEFPLRKLAPIRSVMTLRRHLHSAKLLKPHLLSLNHLIQRRKLTDKPMPHDPEQESRIF